jgi:hypothetical protein
MVESGQVQRQNERYNIKMLKFSYFFQRESFIRAIRLAVVVVVIGIGRLVSCYGQVGNPKNHRLVNGFAEHRAEARLSMVTHMAALLYPGSFRHYSNAYRASFNDEYGLSNTVLPAYTTQQVHWMMTEIRPVPRMSVGHYCDRLGSLIGCVDPLRLTAEQQHAICVEVSRILPTLPTGTDHPLPVGISEMFADLHYWQALPEVRALLPQYSSEHDADASWDTSEARLRSAISKLEHEKQANTEAAHHHVPRNLPASQR